MAVTWHNICSTTQVLSMESNIAAHLSNLRRSHLEALARYEHLEASARLVLADADFRLRQSATRIRGDSSVRSSELVSRPAAVQVDRLRQAGAKATPNRGPRLPRAIVTN
jgi:hypothetical protein